MEATLKNLIDRKSLRWIFVGGKGGVGKTTCSSLAMQMAKVRRSVLLVSTDPAHNLSDAFGQKFTKTPTAVGGVDNLFAMEIDASLETNNWNDDFLEEPNNFVEMGKNFMMDVCSSVPGIDETVSFAEVLKLIRDMDFDVVIFDTAPTGHTLRLLSLPQAIEKVMSRVMRFRSTISSFIKQIGMLAGVPNCADETMLQKLENIFPVVQEVNKQFRNPEMTTFVCVCIAEFLSLYETERLVQDLAKQKMDTQNIVVNQLLLNDKSTCSMCLARRRIQKKYLDQIQELYEDFHVVLLPLLDCEVRGVKAIQSFSENLIQPYAANN